MELHWEAAEAAPEAAGLAEAERVAADSAAGSEEAARVEAGLAEDSAEEGSEAEATAPPREDTEVDSEAEDLAVAPVAGLEEG
jgi:hypothetical protein